MPDWDGYLGQFHTEHPGITQDLLTKAPYDDSTAYEWLADAVPGGGVVLDLACGSGPLVGLLPDAMLHVGLDLSAAELLLASGRGLLVARADAGRLPLRDATVDTVVMSMALMLVPLAEALREIRRVLKPGGMLIATLPASSPLGVRDALRWGRLLLALRQRGLSYPHDVSPGQLEQQGLVVESDDRRSFSFAVRAASDADLLVDSLYLPDVDAERLAAARSIAHGWIGKSVSIPLRRVVAHRHD